MKTQPITEYNPHALKEISKHLEFSKYSNSQVTKTLDYENFVDIVDDVSTILAAIEIIGFQGNSQNLGTCAGLAQIAQKLLPRNEMNFLDRLLIKKEDSNTTFSKIENL